METTQGRARRGDTRQRIQDVAVELFAEQGYEKTSLREIADRLDVTKAALYYHFKTKEDILVSIFDDLGAPVEALIEWAEGQPRTPETKREVVRRYGEVMQDAGPLFRFLHENQATVRDLDIGNTVKERLLRLIDVLVEEGAPLSDRIRCHLAMFAMHGLPFILQSSDAPVEDKRMAAREVAFQLIEATVSGAPEA
ncbi:TetR/AcrR family transcriptional regulator [Wenjunlia tyrosinilytica]|jgi:AcrR family transcriptional regulator|nr:TetR/AcrR family transcriptional regulator [Wenjunlia tyrosinilytica]